MLGDYANYPNHAFAVDELALVANFLNRCANFHDILPDPLNDPAPCEVVFGELDFHPVAR